MFPNFTCVIFIAKEYRIFLIGLEIEHKEFSHNNYKNKVYE